MNDTNQTRTTRIIPRDISQPISGEMMQQLRERWPNPERLTVAWRLAKDVDTCEALLLGQPVDPSRIHPDQLRWAKQRFLVRLDFHAIDLLTAA